jgi:two-component system alkaline phosphatase synthesis response regulator PhoP
VVAQVAAFDDGFLRVRHCSTASEILYLAGRVRPGLIVMRAAYCDGATADVVATIRRHDELPIVVSVGEGETDVARSALLAGATELIDRPYRGGQLKDLLSRHLPALTTQRLSAAKVHFGGLVLDGPAYVAWANERKLSLTTREFEVLQILVSQAGRVVTFEDIRDKVWGARGETVTRQTVKVHMHRLRDHIAEAADLTAVRGVGYLLSA